MEGIAEVIGRIIDKARVATGFRTIFDASGLALRRIENGSTEKYPASAVKADKLTPEVGRRETSKTATAPGGNDEGWPANRPAMRLGDTNTTLPRQLGVEHRMPLERPLRCNDAASVTRLLHRTDLGIGDRIDPDMALEPNDFEPVGCEVCDRLRTLGGLDGTPAEGLLHWNTHARPSQPIRAMTNTNSHAAAPIRHHDINGIGSSSGLRDESEW